MKDSGEFKIILKADYKNIIDAKHALQDPFVEDFVEETGHFRLQDFENIRAADGISLGDLEIAQIDDETFEVSCARTSPILSKRRADELAKILDDYGMFDEVEIKDFE